LGEKYKCISGKESRGELICMIARINKRDTSEGQKATKGEKSTSKGMYMGLY
jgi:hypothetical protein